MSGEDFSLKLCAIGEKTDDKSFYYDNLYEISKRLAICKNHEKI